MPSKPLGNIILPLTLGFGLLFFTNKISAQNTPPIFEKLSRNLKDYVGHRGPEKVYVQSDKELYSNGETIWYKIYLVDGVSHRQTQKSRVVHLELLNSKDSLVHQQMLYVKGKGAFGDIQLSESVASGNYVLRAYTEYMLNEKEPIFFEKQISILAIPRRNVVDDSTETFPEQVLSKSISEIPRIAFFPEGGYLVADKENVMGLQVTDNQGNGIKVHGKIMDEASNPVGFFKSHEFGLGSVNFTPIKGKKYFAHINYNGTPEKIPIPEALEHGYLMQLKNKGGYIHLRVSENHPDGLEGLFILAHLRGEIIYQHQISKTVKGGDYVFKLSTEGLRDGVAHFTLFSKAGEPLSERLVFIDAPHNDLELEIHTESVEYGTREPVAVKVKLRQFEHVPLTGDFSVAITENYGRQQQHLTSIKSWLLLNSDLGGTIHNPDYFFDKATANREQMLDLLMLTHGWRRFVWKELKRTDDRGPLAIHPETGIWISGKTIAFKNNNIPVISEVKLTILDEGAYQEEDVTDGKGEFTFGPFVFQDSIRGVIEAFAMERRKSRVAIYLDSVEIAPKPFRNRLETQGTPFSITNLEKSYLQKISAKKKADSLFGHKVTQLDEVTVTGEHKTRADLILEKIDEVTLHKEPTARLFRDSLPGLQGATVMDMLRRVPGVQLFGESPNQTVILRSVSSQKGSFPIFFVDGARTEQSFISTMLAREVLFVDVLKGPRAAIYGTGSNSGVVAIYTPGSLRIPTEITPKTPGVTGFVKSGFYKAREFFSPNHANPDSMERPDLRTTLHWEPQLNLSAEKPAEINFYTADTSGEYTIKVEGITDDGRPVEGVSRFLVKRSASKL